MVDHIRSRRAALHAMSAAAIFATLPLAPVQAASEATTLAIQEALASMGFDPGLPDGKAGSNTERAIKAFQREFGYAATGVADETLLTRLNSALAQGAASPERLLRREGLLRAYTRAVQDGLFALGFGPGPVDGAVGPMTREAIRAFQTSNGLASTGEISKPLLSAINTARGL